LFKKMCTKMCVFFPVATKCEKKLQNEINIEWDKNRDIELGVSK
jgi:hypothetical protein